MTDNVRSIQNPLFNGELREKLEASASQYTPHVVAAVTSFEQTLLSHMMIKARELGTYLGQKLADKVLNAPRNGS
jgi:hypothetical protein